MFIRDSCQENSLMQPTRFLSFVPKEMGLSVFTLPRYFTSLKPPGRGSPLGSRLGACRTGVPTGQLRRGEEIVPIKPLVCVEKGLFGGSRPSARTPHPRHAPACSPGFNSAQGGAERTPVALHKSSSSAERTPPPAVTAR